MDFTAKSRPIPRAKLAAQIAKSVGKFIEVSRETTRLGLSSHAITSERETYSRPVHLGRDITGEHRFDSNLPCFCSFVATRNVCRVCIEPTEYIGSIPILLWFVCLRLRWRNTGGPVASRIGLPC